MGLVASVKTCLRKYVTFRGRATKAEFWYFILFLILGFIALTVLNSLIFGPEITERPVLNADGDVIGRNVNYAYNSGIFGTIFGLLVLLPWLAVTWRRMHDSDRRGFLPFLSLFLWVITLILIIAVPMGFGTFWETLSTYGVVRVQNTSGAAFAIVAFFGALLLNLYWLTRPSTEGTNRFGPPSGQAPVSSEVFK